MAGVIQGKNCILKMNLLGDMMPIVCAKSFSLNTVTDEVETTTQGLGQWKSFDYDALSYTLSLENVVKATDTNIVTYDMLTAQTQFIEVGFQIFYQDDDLVTIIITGTAIILNTTLNAVYGEVLSDSIEMHGQGAYTLERIVDPVLFKIIINGDSPATVLFRLLNNLDEIILSKSGLTLGTNASYFIPKGMYKAYSEVTTTGEDNNLSIDTPAAVNFDFDGDETINLPTLRDYYAMRTATFTIGVTPPPPCTEVAIVGSPELPDSTTGAPYSYSFGLTGSTPFGLTINAKPAWMNISITGSTVSFTGTPTEAGTNIEVDIDITNCSAGLVNFADTIDITEEPFTSLDWTFTEVDTEGSLKISKNGVTQVFVLDTDSGAFAMAAGDSINVRVSAGTGGETRYLKVEDTTAATTLYEFSLTAGINSYTFVATLNHHYLITSYVQI